MGVRKAVDSKRVLQVTQSHWYWHSIWDPKF